MDGASTTFFTKPSLTPERKEFYQRLDARGTAPLWEVLGLSADPKIDYDIVAQVGTAFDGGQPMLLKVDFVI